MSVNDAMKERGLVNTSELTSKVFKGEEVALRFRYPTDEILLTINSLVAKILGNIDLIYLLDTIITILREILLNAVKANAKRIFFANQDYQIAIEGDYSLGMKEFKTKVINDLDSFSRELSVSTYSVLFKVKKTDTGITISVKNNIPIHPEELKRIKLRIKKAVASRDFTEVYEDVYDASEGAGLGITLIILLLRNAGIESSNFSIITDADSVTATVTIPFQLRPEETITKIKQDILQQVKALPTFPENILHLQGLCRNPKASIEDIAKGISADPALTAEVLRLANSAGFITGKRVKNINEAVMIIGLKNLEAILTVAAARKILDKRYKKFEQIWSHCNRTAFYSRAIAAEIGLPTITDQVSISALLHDIGKIILLSTDQDLVNKVSKLVENRKIRSSTIMEEIAIGISHSTIGALMANKWNFPDYLVEAINYHHTPLHADSSYKKIVSVVYLANIFAGIETKKYDLSYIEAEVMDILELEIDDKLISMGGRLRKQYDEYSSTL